jgi:hypothetical protein
MSLECSSFVFRACKVCIACILGVIVATGVAHAQRPPPTSPIPTSAILPPAFDRAMQDRIERAQLFTQIPIDLEWGLP